MIFRSKKCAVAFSKQAKADEALRNPLPKIVTTEALPKAYWAYGSDKLGDACNLRGPYDSLRQANVVERSAKYAADGAFWMGVAFVSGLMLIPTFFSPTWYLTDITALLCYLAGMFVGHITGR